MRHSSRVYAFFLSIVTLASAAVAVAVDPDTQSIVAKSVSANDADWKALADFNFTERDRTKTGTKEYRVVKIFGSPYSRLIAINGHPLPPDAEREQQDKYEHTIAQRKAESSEQRSQRVAKYEKERSRDHMMMSQLTKAFDFTLQQETHLGSHGVYVLHASRRAGYKPPNMECQALTGMEGTLWIDKTSFHWVKVEAHVVQPVSIEGFLARVEPGTHFELDQSPVATNLWLPSHFLMRSRAKVLDVFNHRTQDNETYFDYKKADSDNLVPLQSRQDGKPHN